MDSLTVTERVENADWLEPVADTLQQAVGSAYQATGAAGQKVADALNGVWLGHPLHPAMTDIPIGAWTAAAVFDIMEASGNDAIAPGADAAVAVGLVGAVGAALTGLTDWHKLSEKPEKRVGAAHALLNIAATALYATSLIARRKGARGLGRALSFTGYALVGASSYLGGALVSDLKIGVDHAPREGLAEDWITALPLDELEDDKPVKANAGGTDVMLLKRGEKIFALANACSHLGGPLNEGSLCNGSITCPWHGSRFALDDGRVLDGPATYAQPRFDVRVQDGQVQVKAAKHE